MSASIESLGVSVNGKVTRRYDDKQDRTTLVVSEEQAREMAAALAPVLKFFDEQEGAGHGPDRRQAPAG
jgi:hypothetical protein